MFLWSKFTYCKVPRRPEINTILMGFINIRGNILMMRPLPTLTQTYALLIQEERQREVSTSVIFNNEQASFTTTANRGRIFFQKNGDNRTSVKILECRYCKKKVHTIDKCYKLNGYPSNFSRGRRMAAFAQEHN